jgi:hypothetical protein
MRNNQSPSCWISLRQVGRRDSAEGNGQDTIRSGGVDIGGQSCSRRREQRGVRVLWRRVMADMLFVRIDDESD